MLLRSDRGETAGRGPLRRPRRERSGNSGRSAEIPATRTDYDLLERAGELAVRNEPMTWPRILVSLSDPDQSTVVTNLARDWIARSLPGSINSGSLGVVELGIPPDIEFAQRIAQLPGVLGVYSAETPVSLVTPKETATPLMDAARGLVGLPDGLPVNPSTSVNLCVVDSGLDLSHPDFSVLPNDALRNFTDESDVRDGLGHGTHVASIAMGTGQASGGKYAGIAPGVNLLVGKVVEADGYASLGYILDALMWAYEMEADVINLSLGATRTDDGESMLTRACQRLTELGPIVCAAAGNEGPLPGSLFSPADGRDVIAVGAVDKSLGLTDFSSRGESDPGHRLHTKPDCVAPGVMITAARSAVSDGQHDRPYVSMSGTSMATPVVAGSAAYLMSHALQTNSRQDARQRTKTALLSTASKQLLDGNNGNKYEVGRGLIDVTASLDDIR